MLSFKAVEVQMKSQCPFSLPGEGLDGGLGPQSCWEGARGQSHVGWNDFWPKGEGVWGNSCPVQAESLEEARSQNHENEVVSQPARRRPGAAATQPETRQAQKISLPILANQLKTSSKAKKLSIVCFLHINAVAL